MSEQTVSAGVQFIIDAEGRKTAVILPIEEYEEMLEDLHLGRVALESKGEPRRPFAEVVGEMRSAGELGSADLSFKSAVLP
jgi:PHD/YefM family antitoxin component YafN of YafNO toxin-antitoxin module